MKSEMRAVSVAISVVLFAFASLETPRIFLIGDSTMADKPLVDNPEHGWGQMLPLFFSTDVEVLNHARNGRSTKSFIDEGRWTTVFDQLRKGDYVFIQFGHNDAKVEDSTRFAAPRPTYRDNLVRFVRESRSRGAQPILLTPVTRRDFDSAGRYKGSHGEYPDVVKEVGRTEDVPVIDMFEKSKALVTMLGDSGSRALYLAGVGTDEFRHWNKKRDHTHFTRAGAIRMASLVAEALRELKLPLADHLVQDLPTVRSARAPVIGLDYWFNSEWRTTKKGTKERFHYTWEDTTNSGFSGLGRIADLLGADLDTVLGPPTAEVLDRLSIYAIVDPDTKAEVDEPHFMDANSVEAIVEWVDRGGVLLLLSNDAGNAEFEHFNKLARRFGIRFNEDSKHRVEGTDYAAGAVDDLPDHPVFAGTRKIFIKGISTLRLEFPAEPLLTKGNDVIMASSRVGRGLVMAVGDPWLYNEYLGHRYLPHDFENTNAAKALLQWLIDNAQPPVHRR